ncbi:MAG: phosphodiester glycosidase family protein [Bacillota bacterium]|jgi:hypothetical protein
MKKSKITLFSMFFALVIVLAGSVSAFALTSSYSSVFSIGQNTDYFQVEGTNGSGLQSVHYVEYSPNSGVTPMIAYGNSLYGKSTITYVADFLEKQGKEVIAGINADFFDTSTGIPIGIVIDNGVFVSSNLGYPAIGFKADGSAIIGIPANAMYLRGENGSTVRVSCFNKTRSKYTVCLFDENFGSSTKTTTAGTNVILERVNNDDVVVNGDVILEVVSVTADTTEAAAIKSNQMVLTASNDCETDIASAFTVGERVTFSVDANESDWDDVMYAVGGKVMLDGGSVDITGSPTGTNPRSAVGIKADGTVVLYEVDGRQKGFSVGMTMEQLAQEMLDLGCVDAINLDGGGSSAVIVQNTGENSYSVVNSPSDGSLRKCANYIMLVNNENPTGSMAHLGVYPDYKYVMKNTSCGLSVKAADSGYYAVANPSDVTYTVVSGDGTVDGDTFKAGNTNGQVVLKAVSGKASGTQNIYVVAGVNSMTVVKSGTTAAVDSLSVKAEESVNLDIYKASYNGRSVKTDDGSVQWASTIGTIDGKGNFKAGKTAGSGNITVTYGNYVKTIPVTVKNTNLEINNLDYLVADFENEKNFAAEGGTLNLTGAYGDVHNGKQALKVSYKTADKTVLSYKGSAFDVDNAVKIYGWFKGDGKGVKVTAVFADAEGKQLTAAMSGGLNSSDYVMCSGNIPSGAVKFTGFILTKGSADSGNVYIDQVVMSGKYSADTVYPSVQITSYKSAVSEDTIVSVVANVSDSNGTVAIDKDDIAVYVDGKKVGFTYNVLTGNVAFSTAKLGAGLHRVTVEASDVFGNISRCSVNITAGKVPSSFTDVSSSHWAAPYIGFVADRGIVKGETAGGKAYFNPGRNLTRAEFAVIMARYLGLKGTESLVYADKKDIKGWAENSVAALYEAGVMTGSKVNGKLYFYPNKAISRQEVMTVISKSLQCGYFSEKHNFTDLSSVPAWSLPHINKLVSMGIVNGYEDGRILPVNNITRAEIAKIICGLY